MSRTLKDAPYPVRERRYGRPQGAHDVKCGTVSQFTDRVSAVFYAHEVAEREAYEALLTERGYAVSAVECEGFLGTVFPVGAQHWQIINVVPDFMRRNASVEQLRFAARKVVDHPQMFVVRVDTLTEADAERYGARYVPGRFIARSRVQNGRAKRNLFVEVVAERTTERDSWCSHGEYSFEPGDPHQGGSGFCCFWCSKAVKRQRKDRQLDLEMVAEITEAERDAAQEHVDLLEDWKRQATEKHEASEVTQ